MVRRTGSDPIDHSSCVFCLHLAASGTPIYDISDGELCEVDPSTWPEPVLIKVAVRGDATLWPMLPFDPKPVTVPVGCSVDGLVQFLFCGNPALSKAVAIEGVTARINGEDCTAAQLLRHGDEVSLTMGIPATLATA